MVLRILLLLCCFGCSAKDLVDISNFRPLTADKNAVKVGDIVTLLIYEDAKAGSSANLKDQSEFDVSAGASRDQLSWRYGLGIASANSGDATTQRNGFIKAHITVLVEAVDEYGLFKVSGIQKLKINDEEQVITVSGRLRKDDISATNTAISSRLLDAKISFTGEGTVSEGHDSGVINRLLRWLGFV